MLERRPDLCNQHHHHLEMAPRWANNPMLDWRHITDFFTIYYVLCFLRHTDLFSVGKLSIKMVRWRLGKQFPDFVIQTLILFQVEMF